MSMRCDQIVAHGVLPGDRYRDPATVLDWACESLPPSPEVMAASAAACAAARQAGKRRIEEERAILDAWRRVNVARRILTCEGVDMPDDLAPWIELGEDWNPFVLD